jgi:hypothetical protein
MTGGALPFQMALRAGDFRSCGLHDLRYSLETDLRAASLRLLRGFTPRELAATPSTATGFPTLSYTHALNRSGGRGVRSPIDPLGFKTDDAAGWVLRGDNSILTKKMHQIQLQERRNVMRHAPVAVAPGH